MTDLKPGWKRVKFGELANCINDRVDDPSSAGVERYVGLEHLDPESLTIRRWGSPEDVESTKLRFQPGDIIFGKRRAYQRKLAVADFEGICSAHAMVLRAKPDVVLPEFLPFFMQSDLFMERAVEISVGSLSPSINWKTLAQQEFALPPLNDQQQIIRALRSMWEVTECAVNAINKLETLLDSLMMRLFDPRAALRPLKDFCDKPITYGIVQAGPDVQEGVPYIRVSEMTAQGELSALAMRRTSPEIASRYHRSMVSAGDIVVALRGVPGLAKVVPRGLDGANLTQGTARVAVSSSFNRDYIYWALRCPFVRSKIRGIARGWKGESLLEITLGALRELPIPDVSRDQQDHIAATTATIDDCISKLRERHEGARKTYVNGLNQLLLGVDDIH